MKTLAVVIPVYNEEENLRALYERLDGVFSRCGDVNTSVIFVDDHSADRTPEILGSLATKDSRIGWLRLSRNSGSHVACAAGLDHSNADAVILMAADLQDPPELIPELLAKHAEGYHLVWAVREQREGETWFTRAASELFYWLMNRLTELKLPPQGADFFLADRRVVEAFRQLPERSLSLFAAFAWIGFRQTSISYVKQVRNAGRTKWTLRRKILLAIDSFVGFSYVPLRFMSYMGIISATVGLVWAVCIFATRLAGITQTPGYASLMVTILILAGVQMLMLGILGEYLWRTLEESRQRPRYFIEEAPTALQRPQKLLEKDRGTS